MAAVGFFEKWNNLLPGLAQTFLVVRFCGIDKFQWMYSFADFPVSFDEISEVLGRINF
jgi:hypothetical protein